MPQYSVPDKSKKTANKKVRFLPCCIEAAMKCYQLIYYYAMFALSEHSVIHSVMHTVVDVTMKFKLVYGRLKRFFYFKLT